MTSQSEDVSPFLYITFTWIYIFHRLLFSTALGPNRIRRMGMDGSDITDIITTAIGPALGLVVDFYSERIWWTVGAHDYHIE